MYLKCALSQENLSSGFPILEILNLGSRGIAEKTKALISYVVTYHAADLCLCFRIYKNSFLMTWLKYHDASVKGINYHFYGFMHKH